LDFIPHSHFFGKKISSLQRFLQLRQRKNSFGNLKHHFKIMEEKNIIMYNTQDGKSSVSLLTKEGTVWMNQNQFAELNYQNF
jgi:hypothetical protein